jgi:hypothetical protein
VRSGQWWRRVLGSRESHTRVILKGSSADIIPGPGLWGEGKVLEHPSRSGSSRLRSTRSPAQGSFDPEPQARRFRADRSIEGLPGLKYRHAVRTA